MYPTKVLKILRDKLLLMNGDNYFAYQNESPNQNTKTLPYLEQPLENYKIQKSHVEIDSTLSTEKMQSLTDTTEPNY